MFKLFLPFPRACFCKQVPLSRASFFKQSFHKGQLLQAGLLLARASFYKQAFASQCTWQWMKHASFLKDIPFPRCCGIAMPFCKASPGEPFARVILSQGLVLQLQPKTFCKVRPGPSLEVSSLKPGLVYRRCKRILYLGASFWLSFVALRPIDTLCVRVEMCPTTSGIWG